MGISVIGIAQTAMGGTFSPDLEDHGNFPTKVTLKRNFKAPFIP